MEALGSGLTRSNKEKLSNTGKAKTTTKSAAAEDIENNSAYKNKPTRLTIDSSNLSSSSSVLSPTSSASFNTAMTNTSSSSTISNLPSSDKSSSQLNLTAINNNYNNLINRVIIIFSSNDNDNSILKSSLLQTNLNMSNLFMLNGICLLLFFNSLLLVLKINSKDDKIEINQFKKFKTYSNKSIRAFK